jgi:hypothetical protein
MGATNEEITVDVLVCGTIYPPASDHATTIQNWQTGRSISSTYASTNSIVEEMRAAEGATLRWYFQEKHSCDINSLNFDGDATWCLQEAGRNDAQTALALGQP